MNDRKYRQLINPHSHSDASMDGASTVKQIVKRNKALGAPYVALTEHGNLNSAMELYTASTEVGMKPILGIEAYMVNPFHEEYVQMYRTAFKNGAWKPRNIKEDNHEAIERAIQRTAMNQYLHVTIHFKDAWAYRYFCGLSEAMYSRAVKKYDELKPMITIDELRGAAGHITLGSSCMKGPVQNFLLPSRDGMIQPSPEKAEWMYNQLREIAGDNGFFIEVFPHTVTHDWQKPTKGDDGRIINEGFFKPHECTCHAPEGDLQKPLNQYAIALAEKYGDKVIISLDSHFTTQDQKVIQDAKLGNGEEDWRFHNSYHIMPTEEAAAILQRTLGVSDKKIEEWVDNSYAWASNFDSFKLETSKDRWVIAGDGDRFLKTLKSTIDKWGRMDWGNKEWLDQLMYEINILAYNGKLNLLSYIETIEDIASFCRDNDILMNVRGSAGGSILLYLIGVSGINPMKHRLSFGRFLTEGRIKANTLPDVDMDVSDQEKVIEYLKQKYGDKVCRMSTDLLLRIKSSIKDAERSIYGKVRPETERLTTKLPSTPPGTDDYKFVFGSDKDGVHTPGLYDTNMLLRKYADENPNVWNVVSEMLGIQRNKSTHACGFIIADKALTEYLPLIKVNEEWVTGFSPKSAEAAGLVKFDLLALNTLRDIRLAVKSIKERTGVTLDPFHLPFDSKCVEEFQLTNTEGVFQFDTPTVRPYQKQIVKPDQIHSLVDIIDINSAITALCRPGTLDAPNGDGRTLAEVFVARANGEPVQYVHMDLEPILKETYGIQLYQEQTMEIFKVIGGMDDAEADEVRRGIGKKIEKVLKAATEKLKIGALKRGWTEEQVNLLMSQIMASANYSFNKSHATSYSYVAYACMYLKTNYKLDWWKAILSNSSKDELSTKFWKYVQDFVQLPDINMSKDTYEILGEKIIAPFSILTGVGEKAYEDLMRHTPYSSLEHFVRSHFPTKEEEDAKKAKKKALKDKPELSDKSSDSEDDGPSRKSAVNAGISRKLIAAGVLDSMFDPSLIIEEKLMHFEEVRRAVRGKKKADKVPSEYQGVSDLGKYLLRKQLVQIHSEDLRPLMLKNRGGRQVPIRANTEMSGWFTQDGYPVLDGNQLEYFKSKIGDEIPLTQLCRQFDMLLPYDADQYFQPSVTAEFERRFYVLAYVISEKSFPYKNKTKYANRMVLDINGFFTEEMLWPPKDKDSADLGFKKMPVLASFYMGSRGVSLGSVTPLLAEQDLEKFNMV
jgi:DNA polymerase III subunit alpha